MNILFYPHKWSNSFLQKDVGYFSRELLKEYKIIHSSSLLFLLSFLKFDKIIVYHLSLKNFAVYVLSTFKRFEIVLKADLNIKRTENIVSSGRLRRSMFKYMILKSSKIIIESKAEYEYFITQMKIAFEGINLSHVEFQHNKSLTENEAKQVHDKLKYEFKNNDVVYYLRWNDKDSEYNYSCGLDIFLRSLYYNKDFVDGKNINIVGKIPKWLQLFITEKFNDVRFIFHGTISRKDFLELLCKSKYFILTSRTESYNLTFIEAVMCECQITSTFSGVARDFNMNFLDEHRPIYSFQKIELNKGNYVYNFDN